MRTAPGFRAALSRWLPPTAGLVVPWLVGLATVPLRHRLDRPTLALVLGITVVAVAGATRRRSIAVLAATSAAAAFDVLLTRPYGSFRIHEAADIRTDVALLVLGAIAGVLGHDAQRRLDELRTTRHRFAVVSSLSKRAADGEAVDFLAISTASELRAMLGLRDCSYSTDPATATGLASIDDEGTVRWGDLVWLPERWGLPAKGAVLPVQHQGALVGYFVLRPTPGRPIGRESLHTAATYAAQVGAGTPVAHHA